MNNFDKRQAAMAELLQDAGRSDRMIAEKLGLSPGLVRQVRQKLEREGRLQPGKRVGKDGRRRRQPKQLSPGSGTYMLIDEGGRQKFVEIAPSEVDRQRLQLQVLNLLEKGKVSVVSLVNRMSAEQLVSPARKLAMNS